MKLSTKARYGLRMMIEIARELRKNQLVQLKRIAQITGLSEKYLAQLAIPLKSHGLLIGVSGKNGGYYLSRAPENIRIAEIVKSLMGRIDLVDCVGSPEICLNSCFCDARMFWVILSENMMETLNKYTLADVLGNNFKNNLRREYPRYRLLNADLVMAEMEESHRGCPNQTKAE